MALDRNALLSPREAYQVSFSRGPNGLEVNGPKALLEKLLRKLKQPDAD